MPSRPSVTRLPLSSATWSVVILPALTLLEKRELLLEADSILALRSQLVRLSQADAAPEQNPAQEIQHIKAA